MDDTAPSYPYQRELDILVASGYAEIDERMTEGNRRYWENAGRKDNERFYLRPIYRWARAGRMACYKYRYTTPMAYAEAMQQGAIRHCIHCGRTTVGIKVGARFDRGSKAQKNRTVCVACHAAGKGLEEV